MMPLGLTADNLALFQRTLRTSHSRRVTVEVQTLSGQPLGDLSARLLTGSVMVDQAAEITRSLSLTLLDPSHTLAWDTESPAVGALFADRMVQVRVTSPVPGLGDVTVPVFTGPITRLERSDDIVTIEASGKELLSNGVAWRTLSFPKGALKTSVIRTILADRGGERDFRFTESTQRLVTPFSILSDDHPWERAQFVARGMNRQLFYAGDGAAVLRDWPGSPTYGFAAGEGGDVVTPLQVNFTYDEVRNAVRVRGGTPKGSRVPVEAVAYAEYKHPLSPSRLGRNGVYRFLADIVEDPTLATKAEAQALADRKLTELLLMPVEVRFEALPIPHLEVGDYATVTTEDGVTLRFVVRQFTYPLTTGAPTMSVGYLKRTPVRGRL